MQIKTSTEYIKGLKGIKQTARLKAYENVKFLAESVGDLLFADYGVSGNAVFFLSSYITGKSNCKLIAEFLPEKTEKEIAEYIVKKLILGGEEFEERIRSGGIDE